MACYSPLTGTRSQGGQVRFRGTPEAWPAGDQSLIKVPCGQCIGCRLERSRQWGVRILHEAKTQEHNCFITLTYREKDLPPHGSLVLEHWQSFAHKLRKHLNAHLRKNSTVKTPHMPDEGILQPPDAKGREYRSFRFFHCGEYGEQTQRPHYHATLHGVSFLTDRKYHSSTRNGHKLFTSETLDKLWGLGDNNPIGQCTFESAAYVARYIMKKQLGQNSRAFYDTGLVDTTTGECIHLKPEYTTMSRRPGIGSPWLKQFHTDVYPDDEIVVNGKKARPPKFYDSQFEIINPTMLAKIKEKRLEHGLTQLANNTGLRLRVRKRIAELNARKLARGL